MKKVWKRKMIRTLKQEYPKGDLHQLAETLGVTYCAVRAKARQLHLRRALRVRHSWKPREDDILRKRYADTDTNELAARLKVSPSVIHQRAFDLGLRKTHEYLSRINRENQSGNTVRFQPGHVPFSKGKRLSEFMSPESLARVRKTQFKPGQKAHNALPIGSEVLRSEGYTWVKTAEGMVMKHVHLWQQHNGPLPHGMIVVFRDGDKTNFDPANLLAVTRGQNLRRNVDALSPERRKEMYAAAKSTRNENIRKDKLRIRWGLEPKGRLVKRWHAPET